jgi:hypothetical protein
MRFCRIRQRRPRRVPAAKLSAFSIFGGTLAGKTVNSESELTIGEAASVKLLALQGTLVSEGNANWIGGNLVLVSDLILNEGTFRDGSDGTMSRGSFNSGRIANFGDRSISVAVQSVASCRRHANHRHRQPRRGCRRHERPWCLLNEDGAAPPMNRPSTLPTAASKNAGNRRSGRCARWRSIDRGDWHTTEISSAEVVEMCCKAVRGFGRKEHCWSASPFD